MPRRIRKFRLSSNDGSTNICLNCLCVAQIIGPSTDGGFYLIGSKSYIKKEVWENTEWSCAKTLQTFVCSFKPKPYKLKIFTDVDEFQDLSEMIKEMPSITSKRQVKLIKWVNSIEELIK